MNERESREEDPLKKDERDRSDFVRELVQRPSGLCQAPATLLATPPKRIVQFWDDLGRLPKDVRECMESWKKLEQSGFKLQVFDESSARELIRVHVEENEWTGIVIFLTDSLERPVPLEPTHPIHIK